MRAQFQPAVQRIAKEFSVLTLQLKVLAHSKIPALRFPK